MGMEGENSHRAVRDFRIQSWGELINPSLENLREHGETTTQHLDHEPRQEPNPPDKTTDDDDRNSRTYVTTRNDGNSGSHNPSQHPTRPLEYYYWVRLMIFCGD